MAERQFGPYRLVRQIAVGGMAEIHLAKTKGIAGFEKYVALKMIHPNFAEDEQFIQMLVDEAKIAVQLTHGNIAQTFDLGRVGETYYITMEYVDGADLYKILRRASEQDIEMPLDVCAFVAKEITSALDHAHRKRDHTGRPLGIVHRDVSPQNVLISYAGEIKLVDFGIAKATMKARQTAVGVIKGKYYYMSPEQAWGDAIDYRSDIFSAGIVLYEMITGQMLYLEEDLHKLLDMARKADIAPPSKLRRGVPPQLEKIVMHALQKVPGERYQSAGDFATDLERFLHTYSPVFTAGKISGLIKQVVGDPMEVPDDNQGFPSIEVRDGINSTHTLDDSELAHAEDKEDLRTENSVIFRVEELKPNAPAPVNRAAQPAKPKSKPPLDARPNTAPVPPAASRLPLPAIAPPAPAPIPKISKPASRPPARPRELHEETRQLAGPAPSTGEESGLLDPTTGGKLNANVWDSTDTDGGDDLENIGERTMITAQPGAAFGGFMMDVAGEDGVDATLITGAPQPDSGDDDQTGEQQGDSIEDEEGPTMAREMGQVGKPALRTPRGKAPPPAALAAKIQTPAVSALRQPKASRRTPGQGVPANVLQQIVGAQASEPMPSPMPPRAAPMQAQPMQPHMQQQPMQQPQMQQPQMQQPMQQPQMQQPMQPHMQQPQQFPMATPGGQPAMGYATDASGLPLGVPTPPGMQPHGAMPGVPAHLQPYMHVQGQPAYPQQPLSQMQNAQTQNQQFAYPNQYPQMSQMSPGALYQMSSPYPVQPMTLTGQMRLFEVDEIPSQYKLGGARKRWLTYAFAGILAISVAAIATFLIIRATRESSEPTKGSIVVESMPSGAEVSYDGTRLTGVTPLTIDDVPLGTKHDIKVTLAGNGPYEESVDVSRTTGTGKVLAILKPLLGTIFVDSKPDKADILINGEPKGTTPRKVTDLDMKSAKTLEVRLKGFQPYRQELVWPADGKLNVMAKLDK